jgi:hypothetical protein
VPVVVFAEPITVFIPEEYFDERCGKSFQKKSARATQKPIVVGRFFQISGLKALFERFLGVFIPFQTATTVYPYSQVVPKTPNLGIKLSLFSFCCYFI